jgi:hypothetical protein
MWVMYPATVTVLSPRSRNHSSRSVPVKLPGRFFSIQWSRGREATSGCSSHPGVPRLKKGISGCVKVCWTTTTGRPASVAESITRRMLPRWECGWVIGSWPPGKYSFWTSMTSRARFMMTFDPR